MKRIATRKMGQWKLEEGKEVPVVGGGKRNLAEIEDDRHFIVTELAKGRTYKEVANDLNERRSYKLGWPQIREEANIALVEWKRENMANVDAMIGRELARIEMIERKVLEDYEKSKNLRAVEYACMLKRGFTVAEIEAMFEGKMPGNPQYMETLLHLQTQKLKILGIDKGNDVPTNTIVQYNFGALNEAQLAAMADKLQDDKAAELLRGIAVEEQ